MGEEVWEAVDELIKNRESTIDLILVVTSGRVPHYCQYDYVITPITVDKMVMRSSLSSSTIVLDYVRNKPEIPLRDILFFWNKIDYKANTEVFDLYQMMM